MGYYALPKQDMKSPNEEHLKAKQYLALTKRAFKDVEQAVSCGDSKTVTRAVNRVDNYSIALYMLVFESGPHGFHTREIMEMEREAFLLKEQAFALSVGWTKIGSHNIRSNS